MARKPKTVVNQSETKVPNSGVKYFRSLLKGLPWYFPDKDLGKEILDFMPKCKLNARRLNRDGKIDLTTIYSLEEYIVALNHNTWFTPDIAEAVVNSSKFWCGVCSKYSFMELVVIQLAAISQLGCTVLYKKDMCPKIETDIRMTTITTGQYITPHCIKKR